MKKLYEKEAGNVNKSWQSYTAGAQTGNVSKMTALNIIPGLRRRMIRLMLFIQILVFAVCATSMHVFAYSRAENKLSANYSLTGDGASDIVAVAKAQLEKTYTEFSGFHYRAWCADFVSACAAAANQSAAIPGNASVSNLRSAIIKAGGVEYSKSTVQNRQYVPKKGDIIIFKSNGDSHVGIVDYTSGSRIYYIDGNNTTNGNGNKACVHYSNRSFSYAGFTSVISPSYKKTGTARNSYNDVFASTKGSGYSLETARSYASSTFTKGQFIYVWAYLHDGKNNLYKSYGSGICDQTLSIYRPDGTCACTYTYKNSDSNWIGQELDMAGTWKIQSKVSGALTGTNTQTITVKDNSRNTYNDVFASTKGSGYSLTTARSYASSTFTKGQFIYVWAYLHDGKNNLYKSYGSGICDQTLSIYRPDGTCACTYTYKNSDNNWIGQELDMAGTWKIQSKVSGSLVGTNTQTITVKDNTRKTYNDVFASVKGSGYSLQQARAYSSSTFTKGQFVYVWAYLHDGNNNLYKKYGSGTCNQTISIYRPDGSCAFTYTYKNSDNNWIGQKLDMAGTWKIQSKVSGALNGTNTQTITVKDNRSTYNSVFASTKGSGYSLKTAKSYASSTFRKGQFIYVWAYLHDGNNNLYKSYGSGTCNQTISIYRPDGTCAFTYTYKNSDNNWIGHRLDMTGTWKIQCKISGSLYGTNTRTITVR